VGRALVSTLSAASPLQAGPAGHRAVATYAA
jgi:hypothetical protein